MCNTNTLKNLKSLQMLCNNVAERRSLHTQHIPRRWQLFWRASCFNKQQAFHNIIARFIFSRLHFISACKQLQGLCESVLFNIKWPPLNEYIVGLCVLLWREMKCKMQLNELPVSVTLLIFPFQCFVLPMFCIVTSSRRYVIAPLLLLWTAETYGATVNDLIVFS